MRFSAINDEYFPVKSANNYISILTKGASNAIMLLFGERSKYNVQECYQKS